MSHKTIALGLANSDHLVGGSVEPQPIADRRAQEETFRRRRAAVQPGGQVDLPVTQGHVVPDVLGANEARRVLEELLLRRG